MYGFSCNIEILNNHREAPLISWNPWTPIKFILVTENEMIDYFLLTLESNNSSLTNHLINYKYPKEWFQKPKIKSVYFWLSWLISSFLCNIKALKNHHETPLFLWNLWTPIKLILMAKSGVNNDFLSYRWNPAIPIYNQGLKNNKKELVCQN
jgi:hypothetical protein